MALPPGFDPRTGMFTKLPAQRPIFDIPINQELVDNLEETFNRYYHRPSLWSRFNNRIGRIGNWFARNSENALGILSLLFISGLVIYAVIFVITAWIDKGFWMGVVAAIAAAIVGTISFYIGSVVIVIVTNIFMYGFRFIFWNGWTLLTALVVGAAVAIAPLTGSVSSSGIEEDKIEVVASSPETYISTATLNIRSLPNVYSDVIGVVYKNQKVEVLEKTDGFGRIEYKGKTGYVSLRYLKEEN